MDFSVSAEARAIRDLVARFAREELIPLEPSVIRREAERGLGDTPLLSPEQEEHLATRSREYGLWGIDVPEEFGGQGLGAFHKCLVVEELKRSIVPFVLPPESPNLTYLQACCRGEQVDRYLLP